MQPGNNPLTPLTQEFSMEFLETFISGIQDARDYLVVKPVGISILSNMERDESSPNGFPHNESSANYGSLSFCNSVTTPRWSDTPSILAVRAEIAAQSFE